MNIVEKTAKILYENTKNKPLIIHIDSIGFLNFGKHIGTTIEIIINNKLELFAQSLVKAEEMGANILIPTFSYTITSDKIYDVLNTPSEVGLATEFLRKKFPYKRSYDPIFSYLVFSKNELLNEDFKIKDFNTFGENSLLETVYKLDGSIGSIGDVLWRTTEAHYLEKKLNVSYRYDKEFSGKIIGNQAEEGFIKSIFYCRNLNINREANFKPIINDMRKNNLIKKLEIDNFYIETISFQKLFYEMQKKYKTNKLYFTKEENV